MAKKNIELVVIIVYSGSEDLKSQLHKNSLNLINQISMGYSVRPLSFKVNFINIKWIPGDLKSYNSVLHTLKILKLENASLDTLTTLQPEDAHLIIKRVETVQPTFGDGQIYIMEKTFHII